MLTDKKPAAGHGTRSATDLTEADLAQDLMGNNELHGNDQEDVHNECQAVPDVNTGPEGIIESFENLDPKVWAMRENKR